MFLPSTGAGLVSPIFGFLVSFFVEEDFCAGVANSSVLSFSFWKSSMLECICL